MQSLFPKKKSAETNARLDSIARRFVSRFLRSQQRWADGMQRRSEQLSTKSKRIILSLFCLAACSLSIFLIVAGLTGLRLASLPVSGIHMPPRSIQTDMHTDAAAVITNQEYQQLTSYRRYIDSLARSPAGKAAFDSVLSSHPGLLDSIAFIENVYFSQSKN